MEAVLIQAIDRLQAVLSTETRALRAGEAPDLALTAGRKNQSLLELSRLSRSLRPDELGPAARQRLGALRHEIDENSRVLALHVAASRELSEIISHSLRQAESDGTYDSARPREGRP